MNTVYVFDAHLPSALAAIRSLGRAGYRVIAASDRATAMGMHSRFAAGRCFYPAPMCEGKEAFLQRVRSLFEQEAKPPLVLCCSDLTTLPILELLTEYPNLARFPRSSSEAVDIVFDKAKTLALAQRLGVPFPETLDASHSSELETITSFPCIVKPKRSCFWFPGHARWGRVALVVDPQALTHTVEEMTTYYGEAPLVQAFIPGEEYGVFAMCDQGVMHGVFAHHRLRSTDPQGGASCLRESIDVPEDMREYAERLLREVAWTGPAMVEFRRDARTGEAVLMEINGRFWGSLALPVYAGMDFPHLYAQLADGQLLVPTDYERGVRSWYILGNIRQLLTRIRRGAWREAWKSLKEFFVPRGPKTYYDVESWDDPLPMFWQYVDAFMQLL